MFFVTYVKRQMQSQLTTKCSDTIIVFCWGTIQAGEAGKLSNKLTNHVEQERKGRYL